MLAQQLRKYDLLYIFRMYEIQEEYELQFSKSNDFISLAKFEKEKKSLKKK